MQSSRLAGIGALLGMAMSFGLPGQVIEAAGDRPQRRRQKRGPRFYAKKEKRDLRSPAKLRNSIGKIGLGMHASGRNALGGGTVSPKKDIEAGPARTLSVRDYKLSMAQGRRYNRMRSWDRQARLQHLFRQGA